MTRLFKKKTLLAAAMALAFSSTATAQANHNFEVSKNLDIFNSLYKELDLYYVDTLDANKNISNAIGYMLNQLDPYTVFYDEASTGDLKQLTTGKYAGIGSPIYYRKDLDRCVFSFPFEAMPASEAGVRNGDIILSVDGKDVGTCGKRQPQDYSELVASSLRGEPGTTFELKVKRPGSGRTLTFKLTRQTIKQPSVEYTTMVNDSTGYVSLTGYTEGTSRDLRLAIVALKQKGAKKLVIDLRGNPGGLMQEAIKVVNFFVPRGKEVLSTKGKVKELNVVYKTTEEPLDENMPVVVLVDYETASAAEITAGALQDYDRAVIIGERTYGKGLVQEPRDLPYNTMLKLTTSKYYIPSGRCIQAYDFKHRGSDGQPTHLPDSLSKEFKTTAGRIVKDGGGITPDIEIMPDSLPNIVAYLSMSDALFDYCVEYRNSHDKIASPSSFAISDAEYADFCKYLKSKNFTYDKQSKRALDMLREIAKAEGYADEAKAEFDALEKKLTHDEDYDFHRWKKEMTEAVEANIVRNYYYDKGLKEYVLRNDKVLAKAVEVLANAKEYRSLLLPKAKENKK